MRKSVTLDISHQRLDDGPIFAEEILVASNNEAEIVRFEPGEHVYLIPADAGIGVKRDKE